MTDFATIDRLIDQADNILLTTHENPDGDGLGCLSAMYHYLTDQHKECRIFCPSPLPSEYEFLPYADQIIHYNPDSHRKTVAKSDLVLVFDVGDYSRLRQLGEAVVEDNLTTVNIDHHVQTKTGKFDYDLINLESAATGEILFDYFKPKYDGLLPTEIAVGIYTAVLTDTGSFRYSNTNPRCHEVAIACMQAGIQPHKIYQQVYESNSVPKMKLLGLILNSLQFAGNGELAWFVIDQEMLASAAAAKTDVDGFTDFIRTIRGVEVALMLFQNGSHTCRINFRSKGKYKIHGVAQYFGGGGHPFAAGAVIKRPLDQVSDTVVAETIKAMRDQQDG